MAPSDPILGFTTPELSAVRLTPYEGAIDQILDRGHPSETLFQILGSLLPSISSARQEAYNGFLEALHSDPEGDRGGLRSLLAAEAQGNPDLAFRLSVLANQWDQIAPQVSESRPEVDPAFQTAVGRFMAHFEPLRLDYEQSTFHVPLSWVRNPNPREDVGQIQLQFTSRFVPTVTTIWRNGVTNRQLATTRVEQLAHAAEEASDEERASTLRRTAPVYLAPDNEVEQALELIGFLRNPPPVSGARLSPADRQLLLREAVLGLEGQFLRGNNVHAFTGRMDLLADYFQVRSELEGAGRLRPYNQARPGLLTNVEETGRTLFFTFSGQGSAYLDELRTLYNTYPSVRPFIERMLFAIREDSLSPEAQASGLYLQHGLDALEWLRNPGSVPPPEYLNSVPISMPLIYLTQVANYLVLLENGWTVQDILDHTRGMTGYSQGVSTAALIAMGLEGEAFFDRALDFGRFMFWQGLRQQETFVQSDVDPVARAASIEAKEGIPSPMASIIGIPREEVEAFVARANQNLPAESRIEVSLESTYARTIVSGDANSLIYLRGLVREREEADAKKQKQGALEGQPFRVTWEYLPTSGQFHHSETQRPAIDRLMADMGRLGISFDAGELRIPVFSTLDGSNLQDSVDLLADLIHLQFTDHMMFRAAMGPAQTDDVAYVVDLGSGDLTARSARSVVRGFGPYVVPVSTPRGRTEVYDTRPDRAPQGENWSRFRPGLVRLPDGHVELDTRYTQFTGRRPIFGGGMTPTTVEVDLSVVAEGESNVVELAGGGQVNERILRTRLDEATARLQPGQGIVLNMLFMDKYLWHLQYSLLPQLRAEGYPIIGVTVSAGIPNVAEATEILNTLNASGIWMNSFKPGTIDQIDAVLAIAEANPHRQIIMQIEGGKAGGHHSWEDLNSLLRARYVGIRQHDNVILTVGGGIYAPSQAWDYLDGSWNTEGAPMPVDGVFIGTRLMTAAEAHTSPQVKEALVAAPGTGEWVHGGREGGGVTSGRSGLDAPIYYAVNTASRLSNQLDQMWAASGNDPEKFEAALNERRDALITALNATQKPYFGDLPTMTYGQVLSRMVDLMAIGQGSPYEDGAWLDLSFRQRVFDWAQRTEARLIEVPLGSEPPQAFVRSLDQLDVPRAFVEAFLARYPEAATQVLHPGDIAYFVDNICRRPGKPVNFVPVIDRNLRKWYRSDSLWQANDARFGADQILTIPGPEAIQGVGVVNEPVNDIFGDFNTYAIGQLETRLDEDAIPSVSVIGEVPVRALTAEGLRGVSVSAPVEIGGGWHRFEAVVTDPAQLDLDSWTTFLGSQGTGPMHAIFTGRHLAQGTHQVDNYLRHFFQPRAGQVVEWEVDAQGQLASLNIYEPHPSAPRERQLRVSMAPTESEPSGLQVTIHHYTPATRALGVTSSGDLEGTNPLLPARQIDLRLNFVATHRQDTPLAEVMEGRSGRIRRFQQGTWFGSTAVAPDANGTFHAYTNVTRDHIRGFAATTGNHSQAHLQGEEGRLIAPWSMLNTFAWPALIGSLFADEINGDLYRLVYRSTEMERLSVNPIMEGDQLQTDMQIVSVDNTRDGKLFRVSGTVYRMAGGELEPMARLSSDFFIRENFAAELVPHRSQGEEEGTIRISPEERRAAGEIAVLQGKGWLTLNDGVTLQPGDVLGYDIEYVDGSHREEGATLYSYAVSGTLVRGEEVIGRIAFSTSDSTMRQNPVTYYLHAVRAPHEAVPLPTGGYTLFAVTENAPRDNRAFSPFSGDINAIHDDPYVAEIAGLPATITPGRYSESHAEALVSRHFLDPERIHSYSVQYEGMIIPGEPLTTTGRHVANRDGRMVVDVRTTNQEGRTVFHATYEVDQPSTAYAFTGQGVPVDKLQNMGMEAYQASPAARAVWDEADRYAQETMGLSVLDLVRNNPRRVVNPEYFRLQRLFGNIVNRTPVSREGFANRYFVPVTTPWGDTLHVESSRTGRDLRIRGGEGDRYLTFVDERGLEVRVATHLTHPNGVLNLTQFTQMSTMVNGVATRAQMEEAGVLVNDAMFAGHSLGEYIALAAMTDFIDIGMMMEVVYYRGVTMQNYVARDAEGNSPYEMHIFRPNLYGWDEADLERQVAEASRETGLPLQVVNYNVRDRQYSVTGHETAMANFIERARRGYVARGGDVSRPFYAATTVDVPFHSSVLRPGIAAFRRILEARFPERLDYTQLVGRYIPNLTGTPFRLDRDFVGEMQVAAMNPADPTEANPILTDILDHWEECLADPNHLARTLVIELLANQFASPVRWIETQDVLFNTETGVDRAIEVGPNFAAISPMFEGTLSADRTRVSRPGIFHSAMHPAEIFYLRQDPTEEAVASSPASGGQSVAPAQAPVVTTVQASASPVMAVATSGSPITPLTTHDSIEQGVITILSVMANVSPRQINLGVDMDSSLFPGQSALRNDTVANIAAEFNVSGIDGAHEMPIGQLIGEIEKRAKGYRPEAPGSYLRVEHKNKLKVILGGAKMGLPEVIAYLTGTAPGQWALPPDHAFAVVNAMVLHGRSGDSNQGGPLSDLAPAARLKDRQEAERWIDSVVQRYAQGRGIAVSQVSAGGGAGGGVVMDEAALDEMLAKYFGFNGAFARTARYLMNTLGVDPYADVLAEDAEIVEDARRYQLYSGQYGPKTERAIRPQFDADKAKFFGSEWATVRRQLTQLYYRLDQGEIPEGEAIDSFVAHMARNADPTLLQLATYYRGQLESRGQTSGAAILGQIEHHITANLDAAPHYQPLGGPVMPHIRITERGTVEYSEVPRQGVPSWEAFVDEQRRGRPDSGIPHYVGIRSQSDPANPANYVYNEGLSETYLDSMDTLATEGRSFQGQTFLITGAGEAGIALDMARMYLAGGGRVVLTTSNYSWERVRFYQEIYQDYAANGAELVVVPFSQGAADDANQLMDWIFRDRAQGGLGWVVDHLIPFGATKQLGSSVRNHGDQENATMEVMVHGVERLIGALATQYERSGIQPGDHRFNVLLPYSPNLGTMGNDGMYGEAKAALLAILNKSGTEGAEHESWARYARVALAQIGWTRGTALMEDLNHVAPYLEETFGARTYSQQEMAFMLVAALSPEVMALAEEGGLYLDLLGGFDRVPNMSGHMTQELARIQTEAARQKALYEAGQAEQVALYGEQPADVRVRPMSLPDYSLPEVPSEERLASLPDLTHLDLSRVVVVVGYGEYGPYGRAWSRWQAETGDRSLGYYVEKAWDMGLIRYERSDKWVGWVDAASGEAVQDSDIPERYGEAIDKGTGIRVVNPVNGSIDPQNLIQYQQVELQEAWTFSVDSNERAQGFIRQYKDQATYRYNPRSELYEVTIKAGNTIRVPARVRLNRWVAGQVPDGFNPARYGIPNSMISGENPQDRLALYNLVSTVEALVAAGMRPEEIYTYIHVNYMGSTQGGGLGGGESLAGRPESPVREAGGGMMIDHLMDQPRYAAELDKTLINDIMALVMQSIFGGCGTTQSPVGACATAGVSMEMGIDKILSGENDMVVVGGYDDYARAGAVGFMDMQATSDSDTMTAMGYPPEVHSMPNDRNRAGFMEGQGAGTQILMRADRALAMGLPVYAIAAYGETHADGFQGSISAPGQGLLAVAARTPGAAEQATIPGGVETYQDLLDIHYRRAMIAQLEGLRGDPAAIAAMGGQVAATRMIDQAVAFYAHDFAVTRSDQSRAAIAPLEGALAMYGLTIDDIAVAQFHNTSTPLNDANEGRLWQNINRRLGRTPGNPLIVGSQKGFLGHWKGGAAAPANNAAIQMMASGVIPGNRNLRDVDPEFRGYDTLLYTNQTLRRGSENPINAVATNTLGFGHVGNTNLLLHPDLFFAMLTPDERAQYLERRAPREDLRFQREMGLMMGQAPYYSMQNRGPFVGDPTSSQASEREAYRDHERDVIADPSLRVSPATGRFPTLDEVAAQAGMLPGVERGDVVLVDGAAPVQEEITRSTALPFSSDLTHFLDELDVDASTRALVFARLGADPLAQPEEFGALLTRNGFADVAEALETRFSERAGEAVRRGPGEVDPHRGGR